MLFILGLLCGLLLAMALVWWLVRDAPGSDWPATSRRQLFEMERETIDAMLVAELEVRAADAARRTAPPRS
jgi:hypothetical protein